ncbi:malate dehydrogenase [Rhynchospora pubera]|uniref:malate dehydrogenase n=1 Tax=Rhynchospora pubera TaxID=906938 RepID=A0AAV8CUR3_9POAL|nr:malate dehydrogenase [Rhynchospora pubera]
MTTTVATLKPMTGVSSLPFVSSSLHRKQSGLPSVNLPYIFVSHQLHGDLSNSISPKLKAARDLTVQALSLKVAVIGAASSVGLALATNITNVPHYTTAFHLFDNHPEIFKAASSLRQNTTAEVVVWTNLSDLGSCLRGANVVIVAAANYRVPGVLTAAEQFDLNRGLINFQIKGIADNCPDAIILVIAGPIESTVPMAATILEERGVYNPKKLLGVTALHSMRASLCLKLTSNLALIDVDVPVVGGSEGANILPLFSKVKPFILLPDEKIKDMTAAVRFAGTGLFNPTAIQNERFYEGAAAGVFLIDCLLALGGGTDIHSFAFVQSDITELSFFASRVKLGKEGVEKVLYEDLKGLTYYEANELKNLIPQLKESIEMGLSVHKGRYTSP